MSLNNTPSSERVHIGFFGRRNVGKSSVVNAVTGQDLSVVSDTLGTTTDPVQKAMELLPIGPVVIIDTPGYDDTGSLGELRVKKTRQILNRVDIAILITDQAEGLVPSEQELIRLFQEKNITYIIARNKCDLYRDQVPPASGKDGTYSICISATEHFNIYSLKELIGKSAKVQRETRPLISDLIEPGDLVILVIPIDESAPKNRLILPQQMMIREILDCNACAVCVQDSDLEATLQSLPGKPSIVVTDSQAFKKVAEIVPEDVRLTSFSILMARHKGLLYDAIDGVNYISQLKDGDRILISEGCTHHRQCKDIGTYKIPGWLEAYTGKKFEIETSSGHGFPEDLSPYAMVIHCGGCMLNEREMRYRMKCAKDQGVPYANYGVLIAFLNGVFERISL